MSNKRSSSLSPKGETETTKVMRIWKDILKSSCAAEAFSKKLSKEEIETMEKKGTELLTYLKQEEMPTSSAPKKTSNKKLAILNFLAKLNANFST